MQVSDGSDTALARILVSSGALPLETLQRALAAVRAARGGADDLGLSIHLVREGLLRPDQVEAALASLAGVERQPAPPAPAVRADLEVLRELGRGGMGVVLEVRQRGTGARYALKRTFRGADADELERFQREAEVLASLRHPGLVAIHSADFSGATPEFVMELLEGGSLADRLRQGPLPLDEALSVAAQVAETLDYLHGQGVIHRDLKPQNVLFDDLGRARVGDFGLALARGALTLTQTGEVLGTPAYMSPEQIGASHEVDARSDVYALGALLYVMLTGQAPFRGATTLATLDAVLRLQPTPVRALRPEVPAYFEALCAETLSKDPAQRPPTARAFLEALAGGREVRTRTKRTQVIAAGAVLALGTLSLAALSPLSRLVTPERAVAPARDSLGPSFPPVRESVAAINTQGPISLPPTWTASYEVDWGSLYEDFQVQGEPLLRETRRDARVIQALGGSPEELKRTLLDRPETRPRAAILYALACLDPSETRLRRHLAQPFADASRPLSRRILFRAVAGGDRRAALELMQDFYTHKKRGACAALAAYTGLAPPAGVRGLPSLDEARVELELEIKRLWRRKGEALPYRLQRRWDAETWRARLARALTLVARHSEAWAGFVKSAQEGAFRAEPKDSQDWIVGGIALGRPGRLAWGVRKFLDLVRNRPRVVEDDQAALLLAWIAFDSPLADEERGDTEIRWRAFYLALKSLRRFEPASGVVRLAKELGLPSRTSGRAEGLGFDLPKSPEAAWAILEPTLELLSRAEAEGQLERLLPGPGD